MCCRSHKGNAQKLLSVIAFTSRPSPYSEGNTFIRAFIRRKILLLLTTKIVIPGYENKENYTYPIPQLFYWYSP